MKLKLIKNFNLIEAAIDVIKEIKGHEFNLLEKHLILVPDRFSLIAEKLVFQTLNISSSFNIEVLGISKLALKILKTNGIDRDVLTVTQSAIILRRVINSLKSRFNYFKDLEVTLGFCEEIRTTIMQLKANQVSVDKLLEMSQTSDEILNYKLNDIAQIYLEYENTIKDKFLDEGSFLEEFINIILKENLFQDTYAYFIGFDSLTKQGFSILKLLAKSSLGVTVAAVANDKTRNSYLYDNDLEYKIKDISEENNIKIEIIENICDSTKSTHLINNINLNRPNTIINDNFAFVYSCKNEEEEVENAAKLIRFLVVEHGFRYKDIDIACANIKPYKFAIDKIFSEHNIPYYLDENETLADNHITAFLLNIFYLFNNNYELNNVIEYINSPIIDELSENEKPDIINHLINYEREKEDLFNNFEFEYEHKDIISSKLNKVLNKLTKLDLINHKRSPVSQFIILFQNILSEFKIEEYSKNFAQLLKKSDKIKKAIIYNQIYNKLRDISSNFEFCNNDEISLDEFIKYLELYFLSTRIIAVPIAADCIFIGDITDSFFEKTKALIVLGANSDILPKTITDSGILSDNDINLMSQFTSVEPTTRMINARNRQKILNVLSATDQHIFFSYSNQKEDGQKRLPAIILDNIKKIFMIKERLPITSTFTNYEILYNTNKINTAKLIALNFNNYITAKSNLIKLINLNDDKIKPIINSLYYTLYEKNKNILKEITFKKNTKQLQSSGVFLKNLYFKNKRLSPTMLEKYFICPFMFFIQHGLKLKENEKIEINSKILGKIVHECMESLGKNFGQYFLTSSENEVNKICEKVLNQILSQNEYKYFNNKKEFASLIQLIKQQIKKAVLKFIYEQQYSAFKPYEFEKKIEIVDYIKTLDLSLILSGKIDRVDVFDNYFRIIDYKTGETDDSLKQFYFGEKLQLLTYAYAYRKLNGINPAGVFYMPIKNSVSSEKTKIYEGYFLKDIDLLKAFDSKLNEYNNSDIIKVKLTDKGNIDGRTTTKAISKIDFNNMIEYVYQLIQTAVGEIMSGYIESRPLQLSSNKLPCRYCNYNGICKFTISDGNTARVCEGKVSNSSFDLEVKYDEIN